MDWRKFLGELKRRNVYRVAVTYAVVSWVLIQIATQVFPFFAIPIWAVRVVVLLLLLGFPVALILAWAFELTPEGIKRTEDVPLHESIRHHTGRKLLAFAAVTAAVAVALFVVQFARRSWTPAKPDSTPALEVTQAIPEKSIAVLPFSNLSGDQENAFFADGIQDEILANLAKVADLKVISRTSVMLYKAGAPRNVREIGRRLGVTYLLEGSVQRTKDRVRVIVGIARGDECVDLDERVDIQQKLDAFSRRQLAAGVLLIDALLAASAHSPLTHSEEPIGAVLFGRHGHSIQFTCVFAQGQVGHDSPPTYPQKR